MPSHLKWSFKTPRRMVLEGTGRLIELCYEAAGFGSAWVVLVEGRAAARCPDLTSAQARALALAAGGNATQAAA